MKESTSKTRLFGKFRRLLSNMTKYCETCSRIKTDFESCADSDKNGWSWEQMTLKKVALALWRFVSCWKPSFRSFLKTDALVPFIRSIVKTLDWKCVTSFPHKLNYPNAPLYTVYVWFNLVLTASSLICYPFTLHVQPDEICWSRLVFTRAPLLRAINVS